MTRPIDRQTKIIEALHKRGAVFTAAALAAAWRRGEPFCLDDRANVTKALRTQIHRENTKMAKATPKKTAKTRKSKAKRDLFRELLACNTGYAKFILPKWCSEDRAAAHKEGWDLFQTDRKIGDDLQIERLDEPIKGGRRLGSDAEAWLCVVQRALRGSQLHLKALGILLRESPIELWRVLRHASEQDLIAEPEVTLYCSVDLKASVSPMVGTNLAEAPDDTELKKVLVEQVLDLIAAAGGLRQWVTDMVNDDRAIEIYEVSTP